MFHGQERAKEIAEKLDRLICEARQVERELGDSSFKRAAESMLAARDAMRSRAGL